MFILLVSFLENDIIFPKRILFFEDLIHFIPTKYDPRTQYKKKQSNEESQKRRIEENGYADDDTEDSEYEHKNWIKDYELWITSKYLFHSFMLIILSIDKLYLKTRKIPLNCEWDNQRYIKNYESSSVNSRYFEQTIAFSRTFRFVGFLKL